MDCLPEPRVLLQNQTDPRDEKQNLEVLHLLVTGEPDERQQSRRTSTSAAFPSEGWSV